MTKRPTPDYEASEMLLSIDWVAIGTFVVARTTVGFFVTTMLERLQHGAMSRAACADHGSGV